MTQIKSNILTKMKNHQKLHRGVEIEAKRNPQFFFKNIKTHDTGISRNKWNETRTR